MSPVPRAGASGPAEPEQAGRWLGLLRLDTHFPRLPGDAGREDSWPMPVRTRVVRGASPERVVQGRAEGLLEAFIDAARALQAEGAAGLTTSCGFLIRHQAALQAAAGPGLPVWTSALLALPALPSPGVITVDAGSLDASCLAAAGAPANTPVEGLEPGCSLQRTLLQNLPTLDEADAEACTVAAALRLVRRHPGIRSIVLECTNLPPHADAVRAATGLPVHHLIGHVTERWNTP